MTEKIVINASLNEEQKQILSTHALELITDLCQRFLPRLKTLLHDRDIFDKAMIKRLRDGKAPLEFVKKTDYLPKTASDNWTGPNIPDALKRRHVEITGPASDPRMVYNSFNCGANAYMSDFEDALAPTKDNILNGQVNLYKAIRKTLKKDHLLFPDHQTTLFVRPRGLHLHDTHFLYQNMACPAAFIDFGLFIANNGHQLIQSGQGPYFYLPKLEHWQEAALWSDIFEYTEKKLALPNRCIRATVLIETITAAYEMDAILYALRHYSAGLNCGRWDYIFSFIKKFHLHPKFRLPDRKWVTMSVDFMKNYSLKVVQTCHKRRVHAMGGMSANVPYQIHAHMSETEKKEFQKRNQEILKKIIEDKEQEAKRGHDGAWAAHPKLVPVIQRVFEQSLSGQDHQLSAIPYPDTISESDLIAIPNSIQSERLITEEGLRTNISVGLQYIIAWLNGSGAVGISYELPHQHNNPPRLMEDLATAEISRSQLYQWWHLNTLILMENGSQKPIQSIFETILQSETDRIQANEQVVKYDLTPEIETLIKNNADQKQISKKKTACIEQFHTACKLFKQIVTQKTFTPFIPEMAYPKLVKKSKPS